MAYAACLIGAVWIVFRAQIGSGFAMLLGDRYDGVIGTAILEHWSAVFDGAASWRTVGYFHPYRGTLGYNDGLFLYGLPYAAARRLGADPYLAGELTNVVLRAAGFVAMERFMRQALRVAWPWALLAAVLFTVAGNMATRSGHAQLLAVAFAPLFGWWLWAACRAFGAGAWGRAAVWGVASAALMGAWLLTAFYMAWFTLFFGAVMAALAGLSRPRRVWALAAGLPRGGWLALAAVGAASIVAVVPFLVVYLPTLSSTGGQGFDQVKFYSPRALDVVLIGDSNPLLSGIDRAVQRWFRPRLVRTGEHVAGLGWALLAVFVAAAVHLWRTRRDAALQPIRLIAVTAVLIWVLTLKIGAAALWWGVWEFVPGARGLRVVARYNLFLVVPVVAVAAWYLARVRWPAVVLAALAMLLVAEEVTTAQPLGLDRTAELAALRAVPAPPATCRSFVVVRARPGAVIGPEIDAIYSHNVDAMLLAGWFRLPTINGFSTFNPPDSDFSHPERADYMERVRQYVSAHGLTAVCTLDLVTRRWQALHAAPAEE